MNLHTLQALEFNRIRTIVAGFASSEPGRALIEALVPATERGGIEGLQRETAELMQLLRQGDSPPLDGMHDVRDAVARLSIEGASFAPLEILQIANTLGAARRVREFFRRTGVRGAAGRPGAPTLCAKAEGIGSFVHIEDAVRAAIDDRAEIKDSASPALRGLRRNIRRTRDEILGTLSDILQHEEFQKVVQEPVVTVRDDRYVLPLKPNFRKILNGVVHGHSGSRFTLFVEPFAVVELNNRLAEQRMEEQEEVLRIIRDLTELLACDAAEIARTIGILAAIDAVNAKARFGREFDGIVPMLAPGRTILLRNAKHPLLAVQRARCDGSGSVTGNTIELGGRDRILILSGPNAGGKTVLLKMVGLLVLMAQAGLPITAAEGSELPSFSSLFADIGDEQSVERDLSTFSAHVRRIVDVLRDADSDSLVLLDELGSGTDPGEGSALGAAVLEELADRDCITLCTTHQSGLKAFGAETAGVVNAAMEFDPRTLAPSFRIITGRPGRSYGLDTAERVGVPDRIIERARSRISSEDAKLEQLLRRVEADTLDLEAQRERLKREQAALMQDRSEAERMLAAAREEHRTARAEARREARDILARLKQHLRDVTHRTTVDRSEARALAAGAEDLVKRLEPIGDAVQPPTAATVLLRQGDRVVLSSMKRTGTVISSRGSTVDVEVDGKRITVSATATAPASSGSRQQADSPGSSGWSASIREEDGGSDRVNLIGLRVDEALAELGRFLDLAGARGTGVLAVIHGLGTGALKRAVTEHVRAHPLVASFRTGVPSEGGAGVTIVELKK